MELSGEQQVATPSQERAFCGQRLPPSYCVHSLNSSDHGNHSGRLLLLRIVGLDSERFIRSAANRRLEIPNIGLRSKSLPLAPHLRLPAVDEVDELGTEAGVLHRLTPLVLFRGDDWLSTASGLWCLRRWASLFGVSRRLSWIRKLSWKDAPSKVTSDRRFL